MRIELEIQYLKRTTEKHIRRALKYIDAADLEGLGAIRVVDRSPADTDENDYPPYLRGYLLNGHYQHKRKNQPAEILLYAKDVYFGVPQRLIRSRVATLKLARTLAHEVGHHLVASRGYIYKPWEKYKPWTGKRDPHEEKMANRYSADVMAGMLKRWPNKLANYLIRMTAYSLYQDSLADYWDGNYKSSAELGFRAFTLGKNQEAAQCYRHAMEKLKTQSPSPLSEAELEWLLHHYNSTPSRPLTSSSVKDNLLRNRKRRKTRKRSSF